MKYQFYQLVFLFSFVLIIGQACDATTESPVIPEFKVMSNDEHLSRTREGLVLYKDSVFSGLIQDYYPNDQLKTQKGYFLGKQADVYLGFYANGDTAFIRPYLKGKKHGVHRGWYANGQLKFQYNFMNGLSEGNHLDWYADGSLFKDSNYENGQAFGTQKAWRIDGKLRANYVIREDGRKYGLLGLKRCANIDTEKEKFNRITSSLP